MFTVQVSSLSEILVDFPFFLKETSNETMDSGDSWVAVQFFYNTSDTKAFFKKSYKCLFNIYLRNQIVLTCSLSKRCSKIL